LSHGILSVFGAGTVTWNACGTSWGFVGISEEICDDEEEILVEPTEEDLRV
jgi:hypothetical protein